MKQSQDEIDSPQDDAVIGRALKQSLIAASVLACIGTGVGFYMMRPAPPPVLQETKLTLPKPRESPRLEPPAVPFTHVNKAAGIDFVHENGATGDKMLPETMGAGVAFFDFDGDGDQDLLFANGGFWPWKKPNGRPNPTMSLYRNDGKGNFADVTKGSGLDVTFYGMGLAVGDYDGDAKVNVFATAVGKNRLFHNLGNGKFADVSANAGVNGSADQWSTGAAWFDYDNDGKLDLMVCNYVRWNRELDLANAFSLDGTNRAYGPPTTFVGTTPYLYHNDGGGKFSEVSAKAGLQIRNKDTGVPAGKSLGIVPVDLDNDGFLDVVIANDTVQNFVFKNKKDGTFEEIGYDTGIAVDTNGKSRGAMGIDAARFRPDGTMGVAIGNFAEEMTALYVNQPGGMHFFDAANANGLGPATRLSLTFGLFFFDVDLDGRLDLLTANGHLEQDISKVRATQKYAQPPHLFWNCGPGERTEFVLVPETKVGKDFVVPLVGRGSAFADIDGDGDLDVVVTGVGQAPRLLRNDQALGHHWLRLLLVGVAPNTGAIGAAVEVTAGGVAQHLTVNPTRSYLSQTELPVTFGIGKATKVDSVNVRFPSGKTIRVDNPKVDQTLTLNESAAAPSASGVTQLAPPNTDRR